MWIGRLGLAGGFGLGGLTVQQCGHDLFCVDAVGGFFPDELQQAAQFVTRSPQPFSIAGTKRVGAPRRVSAFPGEAAV